MAASQPVNKQCDGPARPPRVGNAIVQDEAIAVRKSNVTLFRGNSWQPAFPEVAKQGLNVRIAQKRRWPKFFHHTIGSNRLPGSEIGFCVSNNQLQKRTRHAGRACETSLYLYKNRNCSNANVTRRFMSKAPGALGYRMPAEWEPHEATWIAWPHE